MSRSSRWRLAALCAAASLALSGCVSFAEQPPPPSWTTQPELQPETGPDNGGGSNGPSGGSGSGGGGPNPPPASIPPPQGCKDFNPAVIGTCMDSLVAVAPFPNSDPPAGLVGERKSGNVMQVRAGSDPVKVTSIPVDSSTDGGLIGLALSPSYGEDQLVYAYITTATDNRIVRFTAGDSPKPVLTGIPRGTTGNRGSLLLDRTGSLLLATGNAGNPALAADPKSLAGKLLRIDTQGKPAQGNPDPGSAVIASGFTAPAGICIGIDGRPWVTNREPDRDAIYRIDPGKPLANPAWNWPDKPGVAGCIVSPTVLMVATSTAGNLQNLPLNPEGVVTGKPTVSLDAKDGFGRLGGMAVLDPTLALAGTTNKDGGTPISSDDRAVLIAINPSAAGGSKD
ncbi:PQQ-dependent sugar dehydrogenase [Actinocrispum sp. NPDC049592]|uniref:PQQ-dependent sugar dehydrogenase n=1 Tax=Actinocrispum sp. NPDC049592 TaxID=3154835 RepID=UPI003422001F